MYDVDPSKLRKHYYAAEYVAQIVEPAQSIFELERLEKSAVWVDRRAHRDLPLHGV